jgi:flavin-dependent dehydrogenase
VPGFELRLADWEIDPTQSYTVTMRIAIVGAGLTGSYLHRLLMQSGRSADLFDKVATTRCGINPCAWGTSRDFDELVAAAGLEPSRYMLVRSNHVIMDGIEIKGHLKTFDKGRLIEDLRGTATINYGQPQVTDYDRIIDCTGVTRAILPAIDDDLTFKCLQYRVRFDAPPRNEIRLTSIGYAWSFPLGRNEWHIGCGSLVMNPRAVIKSTGWMDGLSPQDSVICACKSRIRLTSPRHSLPFVVKRGESEVWGAGEAIGCVAPLAGDGVVPGMKCVQLLLDRWNDPSGYEKAVLREFRWMEEERRVLDKLRCSEALGLRDAWVLKKNSRRMSMEVGLKEARMLMKHLEGAPSLPAGNPEDQSYGSI